MHREYRRQAKNADKAVLLIHGILGTPNHFEELVELIPENVSVYNMLLDGHGAGVKDFAKTSMEKWESQVRAAVNELSACHKEIYIVAHSMGTLFAIENALENPKITKLFLLAVPLKLFLKPQMLRNTMKVYWSKDASNDPMVAAAQRCCGVQTSRNPLPYLGWVPRFLELFGKIRQTRQQLGRLTTTCFVYQSAKDELVSGKAGKLLQGNSHVTVNVLENSNHYYYDPNDLTFLKGEFAKQFL